MVICFISFRDSFYKQFISKSTQTGYTLNYFKDTLFEITSNFVENSGHAPPNADIMARFVFQITRRCRVAPSRRHSDAQVLYRSPVNSWPPGNFGKSIDTVCPVYFLYGSSSTWISLYVAIRLILSQFLLYFFEAT